jgi:hypothetical protein
MLLVRACWFLGVVALKLDGNIWLAGLGCLTVVFLVFYLIIILRFARQNPSLALLEGAEFIKWHQIELGAKNVSVPPDTPLISDPGKPALPNLPAPPAEEDQDHNGGR